MNKVSILFLGLLLLGCTPITAQTPPLTPKNEPVISAPQTPPPVVSTTTTLSPPASPWHCHPSGGLGCFGPTGEIMMVSANEGWLGHHLYYGQFPDETEPSWHRIPQSQMPAFHSLEMVSSTEGWAISKELGTIRLFKHQDGHWDYEVDELGYASDIDMLSPTEGWAIGVGGIDHYYNGEWHTVEIFDERFTSIAMVSPSEGWIGSTSGQPFYYYNGDEWQAYDWEKLEHLGSTFYNVGDIYDIAAIDTNNIWAASNEGILYYHDGRWEFQLEEGSIYQLVMVNETEGWATGGAGTFHYQDGEWHPINLPANGIYYIDMIDETEGWASSGATLLHYKNNEWQVISERVCNFLRLEDLSWIETTNEGWGISSFFGQLFHFKDGQCQEMTALLPDIVTEKSIVSPSSDLYGIDMLSPQEGWIVGDYDFKGLILHYSGGVWQIELIDVFGPLHDVDMWNNEIGFAVGETGNDRDDPGIIMQYQQGTWQEMAIPTKAKLFAVQMVSQNEAWAVGEHGTVLHYQAGQWQDETFIETTEQYQSFSAIQMFSPTSGWLSGWSGLYQYQAGEWTKVDSPATFSAIYMLSETEGWFAGEKTYVDGEVVMDSYIWHYQDGEWTKFEKPLQEQEFRAIHMVNETEGWMVGDGILYYTNHE